MKSALLECELTKRPQNVVWKDKNGQIIQDSDKYEIMNNGKLQGKQTNISIVRILQQIEYETYFMLSQYYRGRISPSILILLYKTLTDHNGIS